MIPNSKKSESYKDTWQTPEWVYYGIKFDLDPCAGTNNIAATNYRYQDGQDGLLLPWFGLVWMNPPFSEKAKWLQKLSVHGNGIAIIPASVETKWFQKYAKLASLVWFPPRRIQYLDPQTGKGAKNGAMFPSALFAFGDEAAEALRAKAKSIGGLTTTF